MIVKVLIKRRLKEGKENEVFALLKKLRLGAMDREGYITGETLISPDNPQKLLVISTWQDMGKWLSWKESEARIATDAQLEKFLEGPTEYEAYVFSKYWIAVHTHLAEGIKAEYL